MPQDSSYIFGSGQDSSRLLDSLRKVIDSVVNHGLHPGDNSQNIIPVSFIFVLSVMVAAVFVARFFYARRQKKKVLELFQSKRTEFDTILAQNNPYYNSLPLEDKNRFLKRVFLFMESKTFNYLDMKESKEMPVLISGAAVQLTFGLENYRMDYFKNIYVLPTKYTYGLTATPFEGHISEEGIYLSWNDFIKEYKNYSDGENVGLHELSHALTYVNFVARDGVDQTFHNKFKDFSQVGRPAFEAMKQGNNDLFDKYAATNYNEFWAVCIETFFERPGDFRRILPELYFALCNLLNQDPLTTHKIINKLETS
jgi:Mlc titration factor MtfA (ptsG expression regulator)